MPATDYQGSSSPFNNFGRSILSFGRDHALSMDAATHGVSNLEIELDSFQRQVTERLNQLSSVGSDELLSLSWIQSLLDVFLCCEGEFRAIMFNNKEHLAKSPMDRVLSDFYERTVKSLDVCNAARDGIEQIRQWQKLLEIILCALENQKCLGDGQFRRAKKALIDLSISMLGDKDSSSGNAHRNRSFGRNNNPSKENRSLAHFSRSLSWSVSRTWSAVRQLQAIENNLAAPKANEIIASNGLVVPVFTMSTVLLFVTWALVAAIPCQDRGLQVHFSIPRQYTWGAPIFSLYERIMEESKKRDRKNACGLLKEIHQIENCARHMHELANSTQFPMTEEREKEVKERVEELAQVHVAINDGLDPLERQVREVFHRIVRSRTEGLSSLGRGATLSNLYC